MKQTLLDEGALALARIALKNVRGSLVNVDSDVERAAVVGPVAAPWSRDLIRKVGNCHLPAVISAAVARP